MDIERNTLIRWFAANGKTSLERVLHIFSDEVVMFNVEDKAALPVHCSLALLRDALASGEAEIEQHDRWATALHIPEGEIQATWALRRDNAWKTISLLVEQPPDVVFSSKGRWKWIQQIMKQGTAERTVYNNLRKWWRGAQTVNALLPHWRVPGKHGSREQQTGRRRGRKPSEGAAAYVLTENDKNNFTLGIKDFYETRACRSLHKAFTRMLGKYYARRVEIENGEPKTVIYPHDLRPSFRQFKHYYYTHRNPAAALRNRYGSKEYNRRHRPLTGNAQALAFGPGSLFQIDSTIADIYLVSTIDPTIIVGRPLLYLVIDVFSRVIAGFHVSLENASYHQASLALAHCTADKVEYSKRLGIDIQERDWPSSHLPECLVADRGELEGKRADTITHSLNVRLDNTPPYRADYKGVVESGFQVVNQGVIKWLPGACRNKHIRGERDHRLDACLNLFQFRTLVVRWILLHHQKRMDSYRRDEFQLHDAIDPRPLNLWQWGVQNRSGKLKSKPYNIVRRNLFLKDQARLSRRGVTFKGIHFACDMKLAEQWVVRSKRTECIDIVYDPSDTTVIWLVDANNPGILHEAPLAEIDKRFMFQPWQEVEELFARDARARAIEQSAAEERTITYDVEVEAIVKSALQAQQDAFKTKGATSKSQRTRMIRENRRDEANRTKQRDADPKPLTSPIPEISAQPAAHPQPYLGPSTSLDKFKKRREVSDQ